MVNKILITGGLGYVGGRLAQFLLNTGNFHISITSRKTQKAPLPGLNVIPVNYEEDDFTPLLEEIDAVIHLAALNEIDAVKRPYKAIDVNIKYTLKWLKAAEQANCQKFIYFSTIHVYGSPLAGLVTEKLLPRPNHPYSITHKAAEDYVLAARDRTVLDAIVLRLSNSFGAPLLPTVNRWSLLVSDLCRQLTEEGALHLNSDGSQERDFITLTAVEKAVEHLLDIDKNSTLDGLFNLSGEYTQRIYHMAERIAQRSQKVLGFRPTINRSAPSNLNNPLNLRISSSKLKETGFSLNMAVDQEIDQMLRFCKQHFAPKHD